MLLSPQAKWDAVPVRFEPLSRDVAASRRFGRRAIELRGGEGLEPLEWARAYEERLISGAVPGRLVVVDNRPTGLVSWSAAGPLGVSVHLLFVSEEDPGPEHYARVLSLIEEEAGAVAFVPGPLAGLSPDAEDRLMRSRGFRRFGRSEMVFAPDTPLPAPVWGAGEKVRPVERADLTSLAGLNRLANHDRFDRYLFLETEDEQEDARRGVAGILDGRWGEFSSAGSWLCELGGQPVGAVLSVRWPLRTLIADVIVAPSLQGKGVGGRLLTTALRSIRGNGERHIYLYVTEGNEPALRLYRRLGFARSRGPTRDWYNALRIPVPPSVDA